MPPERAWVEAKGYGSIVAVFLARSTTRGVSVQPSHRVSTVAFNPSIGTGDPWIGDYQGLAAGGGTVHPCWTDTRTGTLQIVTAALPGE